MRRALPALIWVLAAWALLLALTGGIDLRPRGIPFKSTDASRPAYLALALIALYAALFRGRALDRLAWADARLRTALAVLDRRGAYVAMAMALTIAFLGVKYGVLVAGGSDSYGYISQADLWLAGDLVTEQPIATQVPWPEPDWTFAPLAYRPAPAPGAIVPVYGPGLAVLMAIGKLVAGACGPFLVTPLLGGLMVWLTFWLGRFLWSPVLGVASAALMATSPTFLFMLMNPMSDVPVSALFLAGLAVALTSWRGRSLLTGFLVSLAIFVRPNLVPIGAVFLGLLLARANTWRDRRGAFLGFAVSGLPLVLAVAAINTHLYGAPWNAGYGTLDQFYAWRHIGQNLTQFSGWLLQTETAVVGLGVIPVVLLRRFDGDRRTAVLWSAIFAAAVWLCYLFYTPYDAWWYLRFLLPAFPAMLIMATMGGAMVLPRIAPAKSVVTLGMAIAAIVLALRIDEIREQAIFRLWRGGVVYVSAAEYVRTKLPENAIILTVQHSGSMRYYGQRLTLRWDLLAPEWWPRALAILEERGYRPYLLVSVFEEAQLRRQFGFSEAADAPGTVVAMMDDPERIRIYDPLRRSTAVTAKVPQVIACPCGLAP